MTVKFTCFKEDYPFFEQMLFQQQYGEKPDVDTVHLNIIDTHNSVIETKIYYIQEVKFFNDRQFFTYVYVD